MNWPGMSHMHEHPRPVITNTTPIISLAAIDQLERLHQLYGTVYIPHGVRDELLAGRATIDVALERAAWIEVVALQDPRLADTLGGLDRAEAEVIALAIEGISLNDLDTDVEGKALDFLGAGTGMVPGVNPRKQTVIVYRALANIRIFAENDGIDGEDAVPG
jgi:hypothetical protein